MKDTQDRIEKNCRIFIEQQLFKDKMRFVEFLVSPWLLGIRKQFSREKSDSSKNMTDLAVKVESSKGYAVKNRVRSFIDDRLFFSKYGKPDKFRVVTAELAIVVIARNEGAYVEEWVSYYKMMGVDHIYFIDNRSVDNTREILKEFVDAGFVTYIYFNGEKAQLPAYRFITKKIRKKTKWVAFLDADEFLYTRNENLKTFLKQYEKYPGIVVNWVVFGPCGHEKHPQGYVTDNYTFTFEDPDNELNLRVKTIAQASQILDIRSPHYVIYKKDKLAVDENMMPIDGSHMLVAGSGRATTVHNNTQKIRVNHYWTKSLEELREKCRRGYAAGKDEPQYNSILERLDFPLTEDTELARICRKMRATSVNDQIGE